MYLVLTLASLLFITITNVSAQQSLDALIDRDIASLVTTYKALHAAPELSHYEEKTATFFAAQLRAMGYTVTEHVGKYERPEWTGYGVVAVLKMAPGQPCCYVPSWMLFRSTRRPGCLMRAR